MNFGLTDKVGGYYLAEQYRKNAAGKSEGISFAELAAAKAAQNVTEQTNVTWMIRFWTGNRRERNLQCLIRKYRRR